jgi:hypothetical protein
LGFFYAGVGGGRVPQLLVLYLSFV